jgi:RHS repeat-associated protein
MDEAAPGQAGTASRPPDPATRPTLFSAPAVTLPKGGGAIRGIGEKFAANPVNGTASLTVPIALSPGRSGFGPELALSYDSGAGSHGCYGIGGQLGYPTITRQTDRGIPCYRDDEESDVFILSGAEDLVPVLELVHGKWQQHDLTYPIGADSFSVRRYRPRVEGLFARIERWTNDRTGEVHWRSITKDNITTLYGTDAGSRICDPAQPRHVFSWLISQSFDSHGNVIVYEYKAEDSRGVAEDLEGVPTSFTHERNRTDKTRSSQRYLKRIKYGGRTPYYPDDGTALPTEWLFEVVFDYGEGHYEELASDARGRVLAKAESVVPADAYWPVRADPVSTYRAGFEIRTYRMCRRILMFHHIPRGANGEEPYDGLVSATEFEYDESPLATYLTSIRHAGFRKLPDGTYLKKALPPLELAFSRVAVDDTVYDVPPDSLENLPTGLAGDEYQWVDLDGEGIAGILAPKPGGWYYKRNLSPLTGGSESNGDGRAVRFGPLEAIPLAIAGPLSSSRQLFDVDLDGRPDLVELSQPHAGFFPRAEEDDGWEPFRSFASQPTLDWNDANVRLVDLTGDGYPDVLLTDVDALTWHPFLFEEGFGPPERVFKPPDEEAAPRLVFADGTDTVFLADMSGDGMPDLVRIREFEISYHPNCGHGVFGAKVTMDNAPLLDTYERFEPGRIRLADIDGSGTTDIIYFDRRGASLYFNQAGNSWSDVQRIDAFPEITNNLSAAVVDLFANGTACLVWSSELPGDATRPMRYIDLMGGQKPHLLTGVVNNLGAETRLHYASSTRFYLEDKLAGRPWRARLPPTQVVETVETIDRISRNRFVTRYAYHHGRYDWKERERAFGRVDQWDTEEFGTFQRSAPPDTTNVDLASHVPPALTRTWFHTGAYLSGEEISRQFAREYFGAPPADDPHFEANFEAFLADLLPDTVIPAEIHQTDTIREACRALRSKPLRQEVYAEDGTALQDLPYSITESNYTIELLQPREQNRHAVLFAHPRETISYHTERHPEDPRIAHDMVLRVDAYGNVERSVAIAYPRHARPNREPEQAETHIVLTLSGWANQDKALPLEGEDWYRAGAPVETRTYEVVRPPAGDSRLGFEATCDLIESLVPASASSPPDTNTIPSEDWDWRAQWDPVALPGGGANARLRLTAHTRTRYRANDLSALLPLRTVSPRGLPGETLKLALTPGLVTSLYGNRVDDAMLVEAGYVHSQGDHNWWVPSGRVFYHPAANSSAATEIVAAKAAFFQPCRFRDPFGSQTRVTYDGHKLLFLGSEDPLGNQVTAGERVPGRAVEPRLDYRVLQPRLVTDPNRNRTEVAFDALGMVVGTAVMGKKGEDVGDLIDNTFEPDLDDSTIAAHMATAVGNELQLLGKAGTRIVYDVDAYWRTRQQPFPAPVAVSTLAREAHHHDAAALGVDSRVQVSFAYSDGYGREIQKKARADAGPLNPGGLSVDPRWIRSGWVIYTNKGKPRRKYEPAHSDTHQFEFAAISGVSSILFYDPLERVVATLHPNSTWEKVQFGPWSQTSWDANDTTGSSADAMADPDIGPYLRRLYPGGTGFTSWWDARRVGQLGIEEQGAAGKALVHAGTPTTTHQDVLGRTFLAVAHNRFERNGTTVDQTYPSRTQLDLEGRPRVIHDAKPHPGSPGRYRIVMRYDYDLLGTRARQRSMEAGERRILTDVVGKPAYGWDSRNHRVQTAYDGLRRPTDSFLRAGGVEKLVSRTVYGEACPHPEDANLRGRAVEVFDQAGVATTDAYDFKGNILAARRQLAGTYDATLDWSTNVALEAATYASATRYDALNRPVQLVAPHSDQPGTKITISQHGYTVAGRLEQVDVWLDRAAVPQGLLDRGTAALHPVTNIDYDAKGQRIRLDRGMRDGTTVTTGYAYDPDTFRLTRLTTRRAGDPTASVLQDLNYTYDPSGNITHIRDDAQQTIFFKNRRVTPDCDYTYDATYRLIAARGREHLGQSGAATPESYNDAGRTALPHPADGAALGRYLEEYTYDEIGNFLEKRHRTTDPANPGWTRKYFYEEVSSLETDEVSNRLTRTTIGSATERYSSAGDGYDPHGNMLRMPHLAAMNWDYRDQLQMTRRQVVNATDADGKLHDGERTWYIYDSAGQRIRKITKSATGQVKDERIYLGDFELYRRNAASPLVRESLHVVDDVQRVALVETRTQGNEPGVPTRLVRHQLGNHLGSAILELDDLAKIISIEDYSPFGTTVYQAVRSSTETPKRYRSTGKERDEESGLYYHGARYYAPWLGRWCSCDPVGIGDDSNGYVYCRSRPTTISDESGQAGVVINKEAGDQVREASADALRKDAEARALDRKILEETTLRDSVTGKTIRVGPEGPNVEDPGRGMGIRTRRQLDIAILDPKSKTAVALESGTTADALTHVKKVVQLAKDEAAVHMQKASVKDPQTGALYKFVGSAKTGPLPPPDASGKLPPLPLDVSPDLIKVNPIEEPPSNPGAPPKPSSPAPSITPKQAITNQGTVKSYMGAAGRALNQLAPGAPEGMLGTEAIAHTLFRAGVSEEVSVGLLGASSAGGPAAAAGVAGTMYGNELESQARGLGLGSVASVGVGAVGAAAAGAAVAISVAILVATAPVSLPVLTGIAVLGALSGGLGYLTSKAFGQ